MQLVFVPTWECLSVCLFVCLLPRMTELGTEEVDWSRVENSPLSTVYGVCQVPGGKEQLADALHGICLGFFDNMSLLA